MLGKMPPVKPKTEIDPGPAPVRPLQTPEVPKREMVSGSPINVSKDTAVAPPKNHADPPPVYGTDGDPEPRTNLGGA